MKYYVIELRDSHKNSPPDFSLMLYRLGKKLRLQLRSHRLPEPVISTDPHTGCTLGQFFLESSEPRKLDLALVCRNFQAECADKLSCSFRQVPEFPLLKTI